ncbi:MAG: nuclease-related domain-containing protein [Dietzia sp.]
MEKIPNCMIASLSVWWCVPSYLADMSNKSDPGSIPHHVGRRADRAFPGATWCRGVSIRRLLSGGAVTEWIVRRWARFGHNRLYAATPGGTDLGYLDLATGRYHSDDLANLPLLRKAIEDYLDAGRHQESVQEPVRQPGRASMASQSQSQSQSLTPPPPPPPSPTPPSPPPSRPLSPPAPVAAAPDPASTGPESAGPTSARITAPATALPQIPTAAPGPVPTSGAFVEPVAAPVTEPRWHDLADTRAGAAARERAIAERDAQGMVRHLFARLVDAKTDERAWRIGADGEQAVAQQMAMLGLQWRILHAVRVGERGADIDHVVIGPGGVFTVNTKHHPKAAIWVGGDTFMVNGIRVPYIRNSGYEAKRASRLLGEHVGFPVPVTGMIAVVGARGGFTVKTQPADGAVAVVPRRGIRRFLQSRPQRLGLREIDAIHEVARRSTTWHR